MKKIVTVIMAVLMMMSVVTGASAAANSSNFTAIVRKLLLADNKTALEISFFCWPLAVVLRPWDRKRMAVVKGLGPTTAILCQH